MANDFRFFQNTPVRHLTPWALHPSQMNRETFLDLPAGQTPADAVGMQPTWMYYTPGQSSTVGDPNVKYTDGGAPKFKGIGDIMAENKQAAADAAAKKQTGGAGAGAQAPVAPGSRTDLMNKWGDALAAKQNQTGGAQGNANSQVADLQKKLTAAGFNPGRIDGIMGPKTQAALAAYNQQQQQTVNASTAVQGEDFYRRQGETDREAAAGITTNRMQPKSVGKNPDTKTLAVRKDGGKIINDIISQFKKGGKINIKPENKGKFTATKKKTGKSTEELTHSKNPVTKKRAVFAENSKKWKKGN